MQTTRTNQPLTLAGFDPAGKLNNIYCGLQPSLQMLVAALGKLSSGKRAWAVLVLCFVSTLVLPAQTLTTLFSFAGTNGYAPVEGLVQGTDGNLYGTTSEGGAASNCAAYGCGTVFKITPDGALTTLYVFCSLGSGYDCPDGENPYSALVQAKDGDFYGTTEGGGANGDGTLFKITPSGALTTLYSFCSLSGCTDGFYPFGPLVLANNGDFYGTTIGGGANCGEDAFCGTFFKITPGGALTTLYSFCSQGGYPACTDGEQPYGLLRAANGNFYGTTFAGGSTGNGTVFEITPAGDLTTLHNFCSESNCTDGSNDNPWEFAGLVQATNGDLYGTTGVGGANCIPYGGCGTVYKLTPGGTFTTLYSFCSQGAPGCAEDGDLPAGLVQGTDGNFYGTTFQGGGYPVNNDNGSGTIFRITPSGALTTLYRFCSEGGTSCTDGGDPSAPLTQDTDGNFYGTTGDTLFSLSVGLGPFVEPQTTSGEVGEGVKILGTDLTGATSVTFNGTAAVFEVASPSLIVTKVPTGATSGKVKVVTPSGTLTSNERFRVLP